MDERDKVMQEVSEDALKELTMILAKYECSPSEQDLKRIVFLAKWVDELSIQKDE